MPQPSYYWGYLGGAVLLLLLSRGGAVPIIRQKDFECSFADGDIVLAFLASINEVGTGTSCSENTGSIRQGGVVEVEAFLYAITQINADIHILPNLTIGYVIMDTCFREQPALAKAMYLVPDTCADEDVDIDPDLSQCHGWPRRFKTTGVIGPLSNQQSFLLASLFTVYRIPFISLQASSDQLSEKSRYEYFLRIIPADSLLATALLDFLQYFKWTYISVVYSQGGYGEAVFNHLVRNAGKHSMCLSTSIRITSEHGKRNSNTISTTLIKNRNARVVVLLLENSDALWFSNVIRDIDSLAWFIWIGTETLSAGIVSNNFTRAFIFSVPSKRLQDFEVHFRLQNPVVNKRNAWLRQLWKEVDNCREEPLHSNASCRHFENLTMEIPLTPQGYQPYIQATYVFAHALHNLISDTCPTAFEGNSPPNGCIRSQVLLNYLRTGSLMADSGPVLFDSNGDLLGKYHIKQYVSGHALLEVGSWDSQARLPLSLNENAIFWEAWDMGNKVMSSGRPWPQSVCSRPCTSREYIIPGKIPCCWECGKCRVNEQLLVNKTGCDVCPLFTWPDDVTGMKCIPITISRFDWHYSVTLCIASVSYLGIILCVLALVWLFSNRKTPIVRSSHRSLSYVALVGNTLHFVTGLMIVFRPSPVACGTLRSVLSISLTMVYAPASIRSLAVYVVAKNPSTSLVNTLLSHRGQFVLCMVLLLLQMGVVAATFIITPPVDTVAMPEDLVKFVEHCCTLSLRTVLPPLTFSIILAASSLIFALPSWKRSENVYEAKFVCIHGSVGVVLWMTFLFIHGQFTSCMQRASTLALLSESHASLIFACSLAPRMYTMKYCGAAQSGWLPSTRLVPVGAAEGEVSARPDTASDSQRRPSKAVSTTSHH